LTGIPPSPRGTPQIEVAFDIDANGIVEVSAKDQATGKQQSIRITASSGQTQEEIDRLIKDADLHAEADRARKQLADARNAADALIYSTEKSLADLGAQADGAVRMEIDEAVSNLKRAVKGENTAEIKQLSDVLTGAAHKLAQSAYQQEPPSGAPHGASQYQNNWKSGEADDIVDAEYRDVA